MARLLNIAEVARRLAVSEKTVLRLVRTGRLPAAHAQGEYRIAEEAVAAYLGQPAAAPPPSAKRDSPPLPIVKPAPPAGPGITAEQARLAEDTFLRTFDQRVRGLAYLLDPISGRCIDIASAKVQRDVQAQRQSRSAPLNRIARYSITSGTWPAIDARLVLQARFLCHAGVLASRGRDSRCIDDAELTMQLNSIGEALADGDCFQFILMASPTGFSPAAETLAGGRSDPRRLSTPRAAVALLDIPADRGIADEEDARLASFWPLIDPVRHAAAMGPCIRKLRETMLAEHKLPLKDAAALCGVGSGWARAAFEQLCWDGGYGVKDFPDLGPVLFRLGA